MKTSTYLANELLDHIFNNSAYTPPTNLYLALFTTNPTSEGTGTEVSGGSYARQELTVGTAASGSVSNDADISFSELPDQTVTHWGIYDASTSGNLLFFDSFNTSLAPGDGGEIAFATGEIDLGVKRS